MTRELVFYKICIWAGANDHAANHQKSMIGLMIGSGPYLKLMIGMSGIVAIFIAKICWPRSKICVYLTPLSHFIFFDSCLHFT